MTMKTCDDILKKLKSLSNLKAVAGMARFGINSENTYGISIPNLRKMAKEIRRLNKKAIETAKEIEKIDSKTARWIAADALKELTNKAVQKKITAAKHRP